MSVKVCVAATTMHLNRSNVKAVNTPEPKHEASEEVIALWLLSLCESVWVYRLCACAHLDGYMCVC